MTAALLVLLEVGLKITAAKLGGKAEEIAKVPGMVRIMAAALNKVSVEETGQPIDWSTIDEHEGF